MRYHKFVAALGAAAGGHRRGGRVGTGDAVELKVGDKAPDFSLVGTDGKTHKLSELRGKTVVVAWFPKAFTGGCTTQCKALKESGEAIRAYDVAYFAASVDDAETNKKFAESLELDFPVLSDPDKSTAKAYGVVTADAAGGLSLDVLHQARRHDRRHRQADQHGVGRPGYRQAPRASWA